MAVETAHVEGATEPWIQDILVALLKGLQRPNPTVLECGGFLGHTSSRLLHALKEIGSGNLIIAEYDPDAPQRALAIDERLSAEFPEYNVSKLTWRVRHEDAVSVIRSLPDESLDLVYLDDTHTHEHVDEELRAVFPKCRAGAIVCGHDVHGSTDLQQEFKRYGGIALDLPRLGPAGGLGIIQVP